MKIAIPKERRPDETRVAGSPEVVKKFTSLGFDVVVEKCAGATASFADAVFKEAGATIAKNERTALKTADIVFKVQRPIIKQGLNEVAMMKKGALLLRHHLRDGQPQGRGGLCQGRHFRLRHGTDAAHLARPVHGRAVVAEQPRRLQGGPRRGVRIRPGLSHDDDGRRHHRPGQGVRARRRRRRPAGHRHRQAPGRRGHRLRCAAGGQGAGGKPGRQVHRGRSRGDQGRGNRRRLRQGKWARRSSTSSAK